MQHKVTIFTPEEIIAIKKKYPNDKLLSYNEEDVRSAGGDLDTGAKKKKAKAAPTVYYITLKLKNLELAADTIYKDKSGKVQGDLLISDLRDKKAKWSG